MKKKHQFYLYNSHWATYWILVIANGAVLVNTHQPDHAMGISQFIVFADNFPALSSLIFILVTHTQTRTHLCHCVALRFRELLSIKVYPNNCNRIKNTHFQKATSKQIKWRWRRKETPLELSKQTIRKRVLLLSISKKSCHGTEW